MFSVLLRALRVPRVDMHASDNRNRSKLVRIKQNNAVQRSLYPDACVRTETILIVLIQYDHRRHYRCKPRLSLNYRKQVTHMYGYGTFMQCGIDDIQRETSTDVNP